MPGRNVGSPAAEAYRSRIEAARRAPHLLVAHHYTRYLGDLSGGQVLARALRRGFPDRSFDGGGLDFYSFDQIAAPVPWKRAYRERLDGLRVDAEQDAAMLAEVREAFRLNHALLDEVAAEPDARRRRGCRRARTRRRRAAGREAADGHRPADLLVRGELHLQPGPLQQAEGAGRLAVAGLDQQHAAGSQPPGGARRDPGLQREPVGPAVERGPVLVVAGLGRHQADRPARHVRRVDDQHVDPAAQAAGSASYRSPSRTRSGGRLPRAQATASGSTSAAQTSRPATRAARAAADRPGPAAQVDHHGARVQQRRGTLDQQRGAAAGDEDAGRHRDPQAAELGVPQQQLQRGARDPVPDQPLELGGRRGRGDEQRRLLLGEHAAGGAQPRHDGVGRSRWRGARGRWPGRRSGWAAGRAAGRAAVTGSGRDLRGGWTMMVPCSTPSTRRSAS